ncbi:acyl carrier protein 1, mitochondrial-like [Bidens hawaiensis]|uniref:acyl carrier protein 1, mitochondrial-like n=1 Tax=Bidens hawaiensis TaxID=980011 RepID=UPI004049FE55
MAAVLRSAILRNVRVPVVGNGSKVVSSLWAHRSSYVRSMSSHDDHLERSQVVDRIVDIVKSFPKVDPSKVTPEVHFQKDLGLDSLDNVEIVMAIEEEFKLEIPDKEADKIDSCALAIEYVYNHPMAS